jgi:hypothetical protein
MHYDAKNRSWLEDGTTFEDLPIEVQEARKSISYGNKVWKEEELDFNEPGNMVEV